MQIGWNVRTSALRALIGFLVAPSVPALALYLIGLLFVSGWEAVWGPKILAMFGYLAALVIGVPIYVILQRKGINSLKVYLGLGALIGLGYYVLLFGIWALLSWQTYPEHTLLLLKNSIKSGGVAVVYATITSAVFWLIAIRRTI
jgi:hypothetical protein